MTDGTADSLRDMTHDRGLKLVKSRRRKPGTGDFGKFGLTDAAGNKLLGFAEGGLLTASADDIRNYLRAGDQDTWQQSAETTPDRPALKPSKNDQRDSPARRAAKSRPSARRHSSDAQARPGPRAARRSARQTAEPPPAPSLVLRVAKVEDTAALAKLLHRLTPLAADAKSIGKAMDAIGDAGGGIHVAEIGTLVGCAAWAVIPTLQHGPIGRVTVLFVDSRFRRRGIGTKLLEAVEAECKQRKCKLLEVMSDIEIDNSHGFLRALKFAQTSYRFATGFVGAEGAVGAKEDG